MTASTPAPNPTDARPLRIIYMGTPEFAVPSLLALHDWQHTGTSGTGDTLDVQLVAVATQPDRPAGRNRRLMPSPVKQAALERDLPVLQPERLRKNLEALQTLQDYAPDLIVVAAYGLILPKAVLEIPTYGCVNVHASLLPAYRGASPIAAALLDGLTETGISIMLMDEGMDTGPVLAQAAVPIQPQDTTQSLSELLARRGAELLIETLPAYITGRIQPVPQSDLPGIVSECGRIQKEDGRIDWQQSAAHIERMTRAYAPWPGAYSTWQGAPFRIIQAEALDELPPQSGTQGEESAHRKLIEESNTAAPGTVLHIPALGNGGVVIKTGQGWLRLLQVQPAGKRAMDIRGFLNGAPTFPGTRLAH